MVSDDTSTPLAYPVRFLLYIAHTIFLTSTLAVGLFLISVLSIGIAWTLGAVKVSVLYVVPILGMATYLAQYNINRWDEEQSEPDYGNLSERIAADAFTILYFNFLFLSSVLVSILLVPVLASFGIDVATVDSYLIVGFSYPILDIIIFERWNLSPAAIPVAVFVQMLHRAGKATWFSIRNLNVERVPLVDLFMGQRTPPLN